MVEVESPLFKDINNVILKNVSQHYLTIAVTDEHNIRIERMTVDGSDGVKINTFTHLPCNFYLGCIVNNYLAITSSLALFIHLLFLKRTCEMSVC
jgi:hypothetical protein